MEDLTMRKSKNEIHSMKTVDLGMKRGDFTQQTRGFSLSYIMKNTGF
jgi:hypothetical protein